MSIAHIISSNYILFINYGNLISIDVFLHRSSDEVLHILGNILAALQRGRTSLVIPKKKPIDELMKSRNMVNIYYFFVFIWAVLFK